ncbi:MAG: ribonuclease J, partial [Oscillospiraceae bacterium]
MSEKKEVSKPTRGNNSRKSFMPKTGSFIPQLIDSFASLEEGEITEKLAVKENKAERIAKSILPQKEKKPQPQLPPQPQMPRQKKPLSKQEIEELPVGRPAPADHAVHTQQKQQRQPQGAQHAQSHQSNTPTSAQPHQQPRKSGGQSAHPQVHTLASETTVALAAARQIGEELKKPFKGRNFGKGKDTVKIIPLGGLGEIGKNITLVEYKNDIVIIDCGLAFPEDEMLGIDLVIPDFSYVIKNKDKVRGIVITHGHEDHIGSLSYLLKEVNVPVYSARLTIGLVEGKLKEAGILAQSKLNVVKAGDKIKLGALTVEFIAVNHSIP